MTYCRRAVYPLFGMFALLIGWRSNGLPSAVSGEFRADETCTVRTRFGEWTGHVFYDDGGIANMAPRGFDVHMLSCRVTTASDPDGVLGNQRAAFLFPIPTGKALSPGRYVILDSAIFGGQPMSVSAEVRDLEYSEPSSGPRRAIGAMIANGVGGELVLTRTDSVIAKDGNDSIDHPHVIGHFSLQTRETP